MLADAKADEKVDLFLIFPELLTYQFPSDCYQL